MGVDPVSENCQDKAVAVDSVVVTLPKETPALMATDTLVVTVSVTELEYCTSWEMEQERPPDSEHETLVHDPVGVLHAPDPAEYISNCC